MSDAMPSDDDLDDAVRFNAQFDRLPANAPAGHAHIIDLDAYTPNEYEDDVELHDAVVTTLFNISKDTLEQLLDPRVATFQLLQEFEFDSYARLIVWRQGSQILVSAWRKRPYCRARQC
jgi:hypothetical protein